MGFTWKNRRLTFETNLRFFFDFGRTTGQTPGVRHGGELFTRIFRASRQFEGNEKQKRKSFPSDRPRLRRRRHRRKSRVPSAIRRDDLERKFSIKNVSFLRNPSQHAPDPGSLADFVYFERIDSSEPQVATSNLLYKSSAAITYLNLISYINNQNISKKLPFYLK